MTMSNWIPLKRRFLRRCSETVLPHNARGPHASPYDVPEAVRAFQSPTDNSVLVIEFMYATQEPLEKEASGETVTLGIGKNSGRLYRIEVRMPEGMAGDQIRVVLTKAGIAIDQFSAKHPTSKRTRNYGMVKGAISPESPAQLSLGASLSFAR
jgi:hypothetical protein